MKTIVALCVLWGTLATAVAGGNARNPADREQPAAMIEGPTPACDKTAALIGVCPKAPRIRAPAAAAAPASAPIATAANVKGNGLRPGETSAQCEARVAATKVKIRKGGCKKQGSVDTGY